MNLSKLKGKLAEKNKTYEQCAKVIGKSVTTFSDKMNGKFKFNIDELNSLGDYLEMTSYERAEIFLGQNLNDTTVEK